MTGKVHLDRWENGVRVLTLNDPDRRNAIGPEIQAELANLIGEVSVDPQSRVLVVSGAGTAFCAGADLPAIFGNGGRPVDEIRQNLHEYYQCFLRVLDLPFPTIAAVQGPAIGAGLNLALCCDIRLAGPHAQFGATFSRIGLHPGGGCTFFLVHSMGQQRALRVLLQGDTLSAEAAVSNRLADELVDDPKAAALEMASRFAGLNPQLCRNMKQSVRIAANSGLTPSLEFETWAQATSATKPEIQTAVARYRTRE
jgi:enoyl-CoA hydratase